MCGCMCTLAIESWSVVVSTCQYFLSSIVWSGHNSVIYTVLHLLFGLDNIWVSRTNTHTHTHTHTFHYYNTSLCFAAIITLKSNILSQIKYRKNHHSLSIFHNLLPHTHMHTPPVQTQMIKQHLWDGSRESNVLIYHSIFIAALWGEWNKQAPYSIQCKYMYSTFSKRYEFKADLQNQKFVSVLQLP